jgi:hypothetical protein
MSAGWMNEFVEIVLGSSIIIPISIGYLGIDKVIELTRMGGLGLGFRTMPYLFQQWGSVLGAIAGTAFFGMLFFAGVTSSLAMGTPLMGFLKDEFKCKSAKSALIFGILIFVMGLPPIFFFNYGVLDEYDYWAGTVSLVIFGMLEIILFSWVFGMDKGWKEITYGADIKVPLIFKFILKYITPVLLILVFLGSLIRPENDDWSKVSLTKWPLHKESIIGQLTYKNIGPNNTWFADNYFSEINGVVNSIYCDKKRNYIEIKTLPNENLIQTLSFDKNFSINVNLNDTVKVGDVLYSGNIINKKFFLDISRLLLLTLFIGIALLVRYAYKKRKREGTVL